MADPCRPRPSNFGPSAHPEGRQWANGAARAQQGGLAVPCRAALAVPLRGCLPGTGLAVGYDTVGGGHSLAKPDSFALQHTINNNKKMREPQAIHPNSTDPALVGASVSSQAASFGRADSDVRQPTQASNFLAHGRQESDVKR